VFIAGFNAYQQKDYASSVEKMNELLKTYPDTPLRDMALFWLSISYYKAGNQHEAARLLSQFSKEYPDNPLKTTVEDELLSLTARYESGEKLPTGLPLVKKSDRLVVQKAKTESSVVAAAKTEETTRVAVTAESEQIAELKQAEQNAAAEKKEQEHTAALKAEQERIDTARKQVAVAAKAEQARLASLEQETMRAAAVAESARIAAEKAEGEKIATAKAEETRLALAAAESARLASIKSEEERKTAERVAVEEENRRQAVLKAEEKKIAEQKIAEEKIRTEKLEYREKAISQYKSVIDKFPASTAAATAAAKLRELGVTVALPSRPAGSALPDNAQVLRLEVAQFAGLEFNLLPGSDVFIVDRPVSIPFEIVNRGNGKDSFSLESAFPPDFQAGFASASAPGTSINQTPGLAPGEIFKGFIKLVIPSASMDALRIIHPVKVVSRLMPEASQSREVKLVVSAPLLRAVLRTEKIRPLPGDKVVYSIAILNAGSAAAQDVTFRLGFPQQLEPVNFTPAGFIQDTKSSLILERLQVKSGESREFSITFQLKGDSLAGQELLTRAGLTNNKLGTTATFVSNIANVESQRSMIVRTGSDRMVVIPGQVVAVPFVVINTGNVREKFKITSVVSGAVDRAVFNDSNRDGFRQESEKLIDEIGPLAPGEEASVVVEIKSPNSAVDASQGTVQATFVSEGDTTRSASGVTQLIYSRPVLKMVMNGRDGRLKPGDVASFDLTIANGGSNLARIVELQSVWPKELELVAADPAATAASNGTIIWRFKEVGAAEKRSIKVSFRVKSAAGVGTAIQVKNILTYEDQLGNRY